VGLPTIYQVLPPLRLEQACLVVGLGQIYKRYPAAGHGFEHTIEFHAGMESGIQIANQGGQGFRVGRLRRHAGKHRGILGVVAVLASHFALIAPIFQVNRQKNVIATIP